MEKRAHVLDNVFFTPREKEVLEWIRKGKTNWEIAQILGIKERTVKFHLSSIFDKMDVRTRSQAISVAIENGLLSESLEGTVKHVMDGLTGFYNYDYLNELLNLEIKRAERYNRPFSLITIHINNFKGSNDVYWQQQEGINLLREVAGLLKRNSRATDLLARFWGDRFVIVAPELMKDGCQAFAGKLIKEVNSLFGEKITVNVGIAIFPEDGLTCVKLLDKADANLCNAGS